MRGSVDLLAELRQTLLAAEPTIVGCARRNKLTADIIPKWRNLRGSTVLACCGYKIVAETPVGPVDVWMREDTDGLPTPLAFRGGTWKSWWEEDLRLLGALVRLYVHREAHRVTVLHEVDSELSLKYIPIPSEMEASSLVREGIQRYQENVRIAKDSPRGLAWCPHCPVRRQCDLIDLETNQTADWPESYRG